MEQPYRKRLFRWEWLSVAFMVIISFSSVLGASTLALRFSLAQTLNADVQSQRGANYGTDPRDSLAFAPVNPDILLEATADSAYLRITPTPELEPVLMEVNVAGFFLLPTIISNTPTQIPASPTSQPVATSEKKPTTTPTETQPAATATKTAVSPTAPAPFRTLTPSPTPQPSATAVTPTYTPVPPTATAVPPATNTVTPRPSVTPTINPSATPTIRPTVTATPLPTHTAIPSPSATATPIPQPTTSPTPSMTPTPTSSATPTPIPTLEYQRIRPILNCVTQNGDDTVTVYYGYQNENAHIVNIAPGANNRFFPAPTNRGQPASFQPGFHSFVFSVTVNKSLDTLFWYLDDNTTATWPGSPTCP